MATMQCLYAGAIKLPSSCFALSDLFSAVLHHHFDACLLPSFVLTEICVIGEMEDLSASVDVQDVYTKIKCKVGSFNIDHYKSRYGIVAQLSCCSGTS